MNKPDLQDKESISTPGLWVDKAAVQRNISQMIQDVGGKSGIDRLRPHIKTHKMVEIVAMQVAAGIEKCKAATPMEAKIAAMGGATDILLAHQPVGSKIEQLALLIDEYPGAKFSCIVDDPKALDQVCTSFGNPDRPFSIWIDVDCGMHRSGIEMGENLDILRQTIESRKGVLFGGLHVYDGHIHNPSLAERREAALAIISSVRDYTDLHNDTTVVGGGTPTFGIWTNESDWECSPGTTIFWDCGYGENYPDLKYEVAAGLVTRVISKPGANRVCVDLGHKSVAAEMPLDQRVIFPAIPNAKAISQSEEHLVLQVSDSSKLEVGDAFVAIPRHICPTVALHSYATVLENGCHTGERWKVAARDRF